DTDDGPNELTPRPPLADADPAVEQPAADQSSLLAPPQRPACNDQPPPATSGAAGSAWLPVVVSTALAWLGAAYSLVARLLAVRWLLGHLALWRLLRTAERAPEPVERLFAAPAVGGGGARPPRPRPVRGAVGRGVRGGP